MKNNKLTEKGPQQFISQNTTTKILFCKLIFNENLPEKN